MNLFPDIKADFFTLNIDYNDNDARITFGDISSNIALLLSKELKKNPKEIALIIKKKVEEYDYIYRIDIAGPGFINIYFKEIVYKIYYKNFLFDKNLLYKKITSDQKYNIEFVSANPTGPLHIGHGRGGIIGDVVGKVLALKGFSVETEYYINDAGSQITKLGMSLYYHYARLCNLEIDFPENGYQGEYISEIAENIYEKYSATLLNKEIDYFSNYAKDILLSRIKVTLADYKIVYSVWFSEKTLHQSNAIDYAVEILKKKGYVYLTDDGVWWFKSTFFGDEKDRVLKKTDGQWTYIAADIAYYLDKVNRGFTDIIMILGQDHHSFKVRIEAIAKAFDYKNINLQIILYQLVTLKNEGEIVRMSKRKGNSIELQNIIDTVGSDVARFFYLQRKADAHLDFDLKEALEKSNKNPVFYIQYALARIKSILDKSKQFIDNQDSISALDSIEMDIYERLLLRKVMLFDEVLDQICHGLQPHLLTYYTIELAALFHSFYTLFPIISDKKESTAYRIGLVKIIKSTLEKCAYLLGITVPERM